MRRDSNDGWDDRRGAGPGGYDTQGGRRGRRGVRADEQWVPGDPDPRDSYPGRGSHRRSGPHSEPLDRDYSDPGYDDPRYRDRGYPDGGDGRPGYAGTEYPDAGYGASGYPGYGDAGYSNSGYAGPGSPGQSDGYGQSGGYGTPTGYPDGRYPDDGYAGAGYGSSDEHRAPRNAPGPGDAYPDAANPPGGYRDEGYGAPDPYGAGPDGYAGRAGYGAQGPYGGPAAYDAGDPYSGGDPYPSGDPRARRGASQPGYEGLAGPQYGDGYDQHFGAAGGVDPREQYVEHGADYGAGADRDARYGWPDGADDTGSRRQRQRDPDDDFDPDSARHNGFFRGFGAPTDEVGHRPPRKRRSRAGIAALMVLIIFLGAIIGGGAYAYRWYSKRHADWTNSSGYGSVVVKVLPGEVACGSAMENMMVSDGIVASASAFCSAAKANSGTSLEPGYFRLHKHMGAALAWALLLNSKSRVQWKVPVPDGLRVSKVIAILAHKTGLPYAEFESALKNTSALGLPSWAKGNPEGFLWPATYKFDPGTSALSILQTLVKQSEAEFASIDLAAKAKPTGFSEYQVITEASLLEGEVGPQYYTKVAAVIDNRLNQVPAWKLQLDSTVAYAVNKYVYDLSTSDMNVNSPYNTFLHADLPPGPIDSPDAAAIEAVLHPEKISDLYFVTVNKAGLTQFTSDPSQFTIWSNEAKRNGV